MKKLISCEYNFDNCCVELKFTDGSMIAIDTIAVENEVADNMYQRSELDWLIYNKPLEYAQLVFSGSISISSPSAVSNDILIYDQKYVSNGGISAEKAHSSNIHQFQNVFVVLYFPCIELQNHKNASYYNT